MKMNLKPWQIGICCAAGIAILGGAGTGIYFGVNRSIDDKVKEQVDAAMESVYNFEAALDESETPTQAAGETTTESTTAAQPTKEPETVLVYVTPTETEKTDAPAAPNPQPEPEPEPEIELVYDEQLTKEVAALLGEKYRTEYTLLPADYIAEQTESFEDTFNRAYKFVDCREPFVLINKYDTLTAEAIVSDWDSVIKGGSYGLIIWRITGNWIFALIR